MNSDNAVNAVMMTNLGRNRAGAGRLALILRLLPMRGPHAAVDLDQGVNVMLYVLRKFTTGFCWLVAAVIELNPFL
jgi:hypothetical protein